MSTAETTIAVEPPEPIEEVAVETMADVIDRLGGIPAERILMRPAPGTATEADVVRFKLCELIDGTIVRKAAMGFFESRLGATLLRLIEEYAENHGLGFATGADSMTRVAPEQVREPDVSFFCWERFKDREVPEVPIVDTSPDLVVEVLSRKNTRAEIDRKRREFFAAGTRLMWINDPRKKTVEVWTDAEARRTLTENDVLEGGDILPGFVLPISDWFERAKRGRRPKL